METPVLYFYSPQALDVKLRVDFRDGLITQWFPYCFRWLVRNRTGTQLGKSKNTGLPAQMEAPDALTAD